MMHGVDWAVSALDKRIAIVIVALHVLAIWAFGSVFWVDASTYIRLAQAFTSADAMRAVYDGSSLWWHNYVPPGVPMIWFTIRSLPEHAIWPTIAIVQHAIAAASLIVYVGAARAFVPSRLHAVAATLLCAYPYYQAFHSSLGTESLSSAVLLLAVAVLLRALRSKTQESRSFFQLLALMVVAGFFRQSLMLIVAGFAVAVLMHQRRLVGAPIISVALVAVTMVYGFALARLPITGEFIAPTPGLSRLQFAPRINLDPSADTMRTIEGVSWPDGFTPQSILTGALDYGQFEQIARSWRAEGLSNSKVLERFEYLGGRLRHDGWRTEVRAIAHGMVAGGINVPCYLPSLHVTYQRGMSNGAACESYGAWTRVFSWVAVDKKLAEQLLAGSFSDASVPDLQLFQRAWMQWFEAGRLHLRDPLFLSAVGLTSITLAFLVASIFVCRRNALLGLCLLGMPAVTIYLHSLVPFAGTRYTYPLLPIYVLAIPLALALVRTPPPVQSFVSSIAKLLSANLKWSDRRTS